MIPNIFWVALIFRQRVDRFFKNLIKFRSIYFANIWLFLMMMMMMMMMMTMMMMMMNVCVIYGETNQFLFCKLFDKCYTCIFQDLSSKNKTYTSVNIWKTIISFISDKGHQVFMVDHRYLTRYLPSKLIWLHLHTSRFINFMQKSERLTSTVASMNNGSNILYKTSSFSSSNSRSRTSPLKKPS